MLMKLRSLGGRRCCTPAKWHPHLPALHRCKREARQPVRASNVKSLFYDSSEQQSVYICILHHYLSTHAFYSGKNWCSKSVKTNVSMAIFQRQISSTVCRSHFMLKVLSWTSACASATLALMSCFTSRMESVSLHLMNHQGYRDYDKVANWWKLYIVTYTHSKSGLRKKISKSGWKPCGLCICISSTVMIRMFCWRFLTHKSYGISWHQEIEK